MPQSGWRTLYLRRQESRAHPGPSRFGHSRKWTGMAQDNEYGTRQFGAGPAGVDRAHELRGGARVAWRLGTLEAALRLCNSQRFHGMGNGVLQNKDGCCVAKIG